MSISTAAASAFLDSNRAEDIPPLKDEVIFEAAVDAAIELTVAYDDGVSPKSDAYWDRLMERIRAAKADNPGWDDKGVLSRVAAGAPIGGEVVHPSPMLSLTKVKHTEKEKVGQFLGRHGAPVVTEVKLDGMAVRIVFKAGRLVQAVKRGDGFSGEDITTQVLRDGGVAGLPAVLDTSWSGQVIGEIYMTERDFEQASANRVAAGGKPFANPRNATAGAINKKDRTYRTPMSFAAYDITGERADLLGNHTGRMSFAQELGFATAYHITAAIDGVPHVPVALDIEEVEAIIDTIEERRDTLGFPIDGAVVKVDSIAVREQLGYGSDSPYWAIAYKYLADTQFSTLADVEVAVGRTGRISLTLVIDPPVWIDGNVDRATGHNPQWMADRGLAIGQRVAVYKANDVIPRVTAPVGEQPHGLTPWTAPETCPKCDEPWDKSSLLWRCHTPSCSIVGSLVYWCSRDALDVDRVGESVCEALVEAELVSNVADLYDLTEDDLANLPMGTTTKGGTRVLGRANAKEIIAGLEASKQKPFRKVITGLGIRTTGRSVGEWLADEFKSVAALRTATVADIEKIHKLGTIKGQHIVDGLARLSEVIDRLAAHGLAMEVVETAGPKPLAGKTYVVSGRVPGYDRNTIKDRIKELGGTASDSVNANTTALVTSETTTSKAIKAEKLAITVIAPHVFADMIK